MIFDRGSFSCLDGDVDSFYKIFCAKDLHFAWKEEKNDCKQNEK